ncbi:hypothetical protein A2U01_0027056 [Trifolium medium]|uniref:Uncharacterized protein n=1 Tax=Trifolium medium TaxID=97028 RepID=A0A392P1R8_9FABA|nr:hypothetical protein [Trifolium medium]
MEQNHTQGKQTLVSLKRKHTSYCDNWFRESPKRTRQHTSIRSWQPKSPVLMPPGDLVKRNRRRSRLAPPVMVAVACRRRGCWSTLVVVK